MNNFVCILVFLSRSSLYMSTYSVPNETMFPVELRIFKYTQQHGKALLHKVCSAVPNGSATSFQGIRGFLSLTATLKFTYSFIKGIINFFFLIIAALL